MGELPRLEQYKATLELLDRLAQIAKAKDAEIAMLKARVNELEEKLGLAVGSCESSLDYLRNIPHDVLQAAEDRSFLERENEELRERAEKAEAERDLYQGCCTRAFDEWLKLHPEGKVWPDGAVQLVELLKAKDAQIEELYGRITGLEMSWAEEVQAKDAESADVTSQRDLLQRSYDSCNEKAEARVKEQDGQLAVMREAWEKLPTPGPWSDGPELAHHRVGCSDCGEWRGTWAEGETRTIEELLIAEDWHKEYCPWLVRHRALADGAGKPQAAVIAAAVAESEAEEYAASVEAGDAAFFPAYKAMNECRRKRGDAVLVMKTDCRR